MIEIVTELDGGALLLFFFKKKKATTLEEEQRNPVEVSRQALKELLLYL